MSAFGIGRDKYSGVRRGATDPGAYVGRVVRWIPGDVLVLYAASILWLNHDGGKPSIILLLVYFVVSPVLVLLGAWSTRSVRQSDAVRAAMSIPAFGIWSLSIPGSGWQRWELVSKHGGGVAAFVAVAGVIFGLVATGVELRSKDSEELAVNASGMDSMPNVAHKPTLDPDAAPSPATDSNSPSS